MPEKNKESISQNVEKYTDYFKEDLDAIEIELAKSMGYSKIIDKEIEKLTAPSLGANRLNQQALVEQITNAVQLQTQRQGLRRDRVAIKKAILDYSAKFADNELVDSSTAQQYMEEIAKLISAEKNKKQLVIKEDKNLDDEIEKRLNEEEN